MREDAFDQPIRLLLVEDHLMMRAALQLLLNGQPNLQVVAATDSCEGALAFAAQEQPDIVLLDLFLSDSQSTDCIPSLHKCSPASRILILTATSNPRILKEALALGVRGLVSKAESATVLIEAIERVHLGEVWIEPRIKPLLTQSDEKLATSTVDIEAALISTLTLRERDVIALIGEGLRNKTIATRLCVSEKTVHNHLASIFRKLNVADRLELAAFARRRQLFSSSSKEHTRRSAARQNLDA